jgi:hypothetical protein
MGEEAPAEWPGRLSHAAPATSPLLSAASRRTPATAKARPSKDGVGGAKFVIVPFEGLFPAGTAGPFVAEGDP